MNNSLGGQKAKQSLIKKLGSEEAYLEYMRDIASRRKIPKEKTTFFKDPWIAKQASKKGHLSRWGKSK